MDGQAADAVLSAYTHAMLEDAPRLLRIPEVRMSRFFGCVFHDTNGRNHGQNIEDPVVLLEQHLYGHSTCRTLMEETARGSFYLNLEVKKVPNWECMCVLIEKTKRLLLSVLCG